MKKTLLIVGGLPGVGKSYICRLLDKKLKKSLYFDSDLFSKNYTKKHKIKFFAIPKEEQNKQRIVFHRAKIEQIKKDFKKYDIVFLDTCFDMPESRKIFYKFANDNKLRLVILEIRCSDKEVHNRIFKKRYETKRMIGTRASRWNVYKTMKNKWTVIGKPKFVIYSDKELKPQIEEFVKRYFK